MHDRYAAFIRTPVLDRFDWVPVGAEVREPGTATLLGAGLTALLAAARRRHSSPAEVAQDQTNQVRVPNSIKGDDSMKFGSTLLLTSAACCSLHGQGYEVWLTDQNNTAGYSAEAPRGTHGGRTLIYDGEDLDDPGGPLDRPQIIDLAEMFALGGPNNSTGANVSRCRT